MKASESVITNATCEKPPQSNLRWPNPTVRCVSDAGMHADKLGQGANLWIRSDRVQT
jgi:hypothetical protein